MIRKRRFLPSGGPAPLDATGMPRGCSIVPGGSSVAVFKNRTTPRLAVAKRDNGAARDGAEMVRCGPSSMFGVAVNPDRPHRILLAAVVAVAEAACGNGHGSGGTAGHSPTSGSAGAMGSAGGSAAGRLPRARPARRARRAAPRVHGRRRGDRAAPLALPDPWPVPGAPPPVALAGRAARRAPRVGAPIRSRARARPRASLISRPIRSTRSFPFSTHWMGASATTRRRSASRGWPTTITTAISTSRPASVAVRCSGGSTARPTTGCSTWSAAGTNRPAAVTPSTSTVTAGSTSRRRLLVQEPADAAHEHLVGPLSRRASRAAPRTSSVGDVDGDGKPDVLWVWNPYNPQWRKPGPESDDGVAARRVAA